MTSDREPTELSFKNEKQTNIQPKLKKFVKEIVWKNVLIFISAHIAGLYGAYLLCTSTKLKTIIFTYLIHVYSGIGITAGAHRLWAHRAYKARFPLRVLLMILDTSAFQNSIWEWSRDHRVHHKYSETDADPHNAKRGFFFSHVGWLLTKKHPDVKEKGKGIDMSDLDADPVVAFQKKYYFILMPLFAFILPTIVPVYFWGEAWKTSFFVTIFRWVYNLNATWLVNSAAHLYGSKPYDKTINPAENIVVSTLTRGEGFHNYHHTFPWDYKAAELPVYTCNFTLRFIDFFAHFGWAYDLRSVQSDIIKQRVNRTGDGTHNSLNNNDNNQTINQHKLLKNRSS